MKKIIFFISLCAIFAQTASAETHAEYVCREAVWYYTDWTWRKVKRKCRNYRRDRRSLSHHGIVRVCRDSLHDHTWLSHTVIRRACLDFADYGRF